MLKKRKKKHIMGNHNIKSFEDMLRNMLDPTALLVTALIFYLFMYFTFFLEQFYLVTWMKQWVWDLFE